MSIREALEFFHIIFCKNLLSAQDKSLVAIKGGCNLRFFFQSNRYSEDIDFDVKTISKETLKKRVDRVLSGAALQKSLLVKKIELVSHSAPKQTDTVQRWKIKLKTNGMEIPSKIEFSRRGIAAESTLFEPIDATISAAHQITPTFFCHYNREHATVQKIEALAGRAETQARDVYDLYLLFSSSASSSLKVNADLLAMAIECARSVTFDQFRGQVVEFLLEDAQGYYLDKKSWDHLLGKVTDRLNGLAK